MNHIDPRYLRARRQAEQRAQRHEHPHLDYPAYVRKGRVCEVHEAADDAQLPILGPADPPVDPPFSWNTVILTCVAAVMVTLLFVRP